MHRQGSRIAIHVMGLLMLCAFNAEAANSILIWPINPRIEAGDKATALWLENRGRQPVSLQVRVLGWRQAEFAEHLDAQQQVVSSPPVVTIAAGQRQMVRLISRQPVPTGVEQAYRVLVDEMLQADQRAAGQLGVRFQMRYSVPLFVFGPASALDTVTRASNSTLTLLRPDLRFRLEIDGGRRYLSVHNQGTAHARLSSVQIQHTSGRMAVAEGLLGYVLPGAWMRWPLPAHLSDHGVSLQALINDQREPQTIVGH